MRKPVGPWCGGWGKEAKETYRPCQDLRAGTAALGRSCGQVTRGRAKWRAASSSPGRQRPSQPPGPLSPSLFDSRLDLPMNNLLWRFRRDFYVTRVFASWLSNCRVESAEGAGRI